MAMNTPVSGTVLSSPVLLFFTRMPVTPLASPSTSCSSLSHSMRTLPSASFSISRSIMIGSARRRSRRCTTVTRLAMLLR